LLIATLFFACNTPSDKVTVIQGSDLSDLTSKMVKFFDKEIIDKQLYEVDRGVLFEGMTEVESLAVSISIGLLINSQSNGNIGGTVEKRPLYLALDENGNPIWENGKWKKVGGCAGPFDDRDGDGIPNAYDKDIDGDGTDNWLDDDIDGDNILNGDDSDMGW